MEIKRLESKNQKKQRVSWLDCAKGFSIVLVIYSHNHSFLNQYIYTFHVHLFFFISGIFHNNKITYVESIKKKFNTLIVPYYMWAILLYFFWFFIVRRFGSDSHLDYSPVNNLIGLFTAQGGRDYMDWGVPLWFVPCLFVVNFIYTFISKIASLLARYLIVVTLLIIGFFIKDFFNWYFWSFDIALVVISFYALGNEFKGVLISKSKFDYHLLLLSGIIHFCLFSFCGEINIYRSHYGNHLMLFLINGVSACIFYIQMFKCLPNIKFLSFLGKNTLSILAMHLTGLLFIKIILFVLLDISVFKFSESQKVILTLSQIIIMILPIMVINKYFPLLNGNRKH